MPESLQQTPIEETNFKMSESYAQPTESLEDFLNDYPELKLVGIEALPHLLNVAAQFKQAREAGRILHAPEQSVEGGL